MSGQRLQRVASTALSTDVLSPGSAASRHSLTSTALDSVPRRDTQSDKGTPASWHLDTQPRTSCTLCGVWHTRTAVACHEWC
jgi:hypothetical protein